MKYSTEDYLKMMNISPIWGFPSEDENYYTFKLSKVRKKHRCCGSIKHNIDKGNSALVERCLLTGEGWRSCYTCVDCLDKWMDQVFHHG